MYKNICNHNGHWVVHKLIGINFVWYNYISTYYYNAIISIDAYIHYFILPNLLTITQFTMELTPEYTGCFNGDYRQWDHQFCRNKFYSSMYLSRKYVNLNGSLSCNNAKFMVHFISSHTGRQILCLNSLISGFAHYPYFFPQ